MDCASCATLLEMDLEDAGLKCKVNYAKETIEIENEKNDSKKINEIVTKSGYTIKNS